MKNNYKFKTSSVSFFKNTTIQFKLKTSGIFLFDSMYSLYPLLSHLLSLQQTSKKFLHTKKKSNSTYCKAQMLWNSYKYLFSKPTPIDNTIYMLFHFTETHISGNQVQLHTWAFFNQTCIVISYKSIRQKQQFHVLKGVICFPQLKNIRYVNKEHTVLTAVNSDECVKMQAAKAVTV